jgi:hypothetical protein
MATYGLVFYEDRSEEEVQKQLASEYAQLKRGMAVAGALKKAEFHDAYLAKLDQIGLARWTQSEIAEGAANALRESAAQHHAKALELEKEGLLGRAFDEARIASERMPCDRALSEHFYTVRIEHVNKNMVPMTTQPEGTNRTILEQIVRELDGLGNGQNLDPIRIDYFKGRIEEGLRIDRTYLPLQLKRADFLLRIGDLTGAQKVVMEAERDFQLTKQDADAWLRMDASLAERKLTTQARSEKDVNEFFGLGKFVEALGTAEGGLKADPWNPKLLFNASKAAAVLREGAKAQNYARTYLQSANMACVSSDEDTATMISLFVDHKSRILEGPIGDNQYPHWISGKRYRIDEVAYDPLSGGFFQQVRTISSTKDGSTTSFRWDGFAVTSIASIRKNGNDKNASEIISSELEPKYRRGSVHMSEIGMKAGSYDDRLTYSLLYPNSPDFDPTLAEKYVKRTFTRGWAGNPFFHPFLWTGIFLFDLTYDDQGRLVEAKPTYPDNSRPRSPFSDVLHFRWDGNTNRLLNISGKRYSRTMKYDDLGRIVEEIITFEKSKGYIEYDYVGKSWKIKLAKISDNFFDKTERVVLFRDFSE